MRMMATVRVPVAAGNRAIQDGSISEKIGKILAATKPENAYFFLENGRRTMRLVFDMKEPNHMVPAFETALMGLDAEVELVPVMTAEELKAGFAMMG